MRAVFRSVAIVAVALAVQAGPGDRRSTVAERVLAVTRDSAWKHVSSVPVSFRTFHPQGMVRIGDEFFVSSVEIKVPTKRFPRPSGGYDRDTGEGAGHLFRIDAGGGLVGDVLLGDGPIYHPGGIDYDGTHIWVPVAEYRPDSRSIIYRVDPRTLRASEVFRFADHIGAVAIDTDDRTLHGVSWGSRRFYRWTLDADGRVTNAGTPPEKLRTLNRSHYLDYQDCKYAGRRRMLCTGVTEFRAAPGAPAFRLGGMDLVDLADGRPLHQVPVLLWTASGLDMTHNPVWVDAVPNGLRAWFMPEDDRSTIYTYEVDTAPRRP